MNDRDLLLRAVLQDPAEDTPRLVYADYLEEHGTAIDRDRAEFIRLHIAISGQDPPDTTPWKRVHQLLERHREVWTGPAYVEHLGARYYEWRRGFVWRVGGPLDRIMATARDLFSAHPVEHVAVADRFPSLYDGHGLPTGFTWAPGTDEDNTYFGMSDLGMASGMAPWTSDDRPRVLPFAVHTLTEQVRDKNVAQDLSDCFRWLSAALVKYGRIKAGLDT